KQSGAAWSQGDFNYDGKAGSTPAPKPRTSAEPACRLEPPQYAEKSLQPGRGMGISCASREAAARFDATGCLGLWVIAGLRGRARGCASCENRTLKSGCASEATIQMHLG